MGVSIITPAHLQLLLSDKRLAPSVVDARTRSEYDQGHIPGAVHIGWEDWNAKPPKGLSLDLWEPGYWGLLDNARLDGFAVKLGQLGISNSRPVVVYADCLKSKGTEGRVAWMLLYLGVEQVMLLDGGYSGWLGAGGRVDLDEAKPVRAEFILHLDERRRVSTRYLAKQLSKGQLPVSIDTRSLAEYQGNSYDYQPRTGHMPQSKHLTYESLFRVDGRFVQAKEFLALVTAEAFDCPTLMTYCEVGVRASTYALLLEAYTGRVLPVYDGSVMEWGANKALPLLKSD